MSAKQFIEEAVIFEGQEKYNGDINKLIESMTVANDGYITIETFIEQKKEKNKYCMLTHIYGI